MTLPTNRDAFSALASALAIKLYDSWPERVDVSPPALAATAGERAAFRNQSAEFHNRLQELAAPTINVLRREGIIEVENEYLNGTLVGVLLSTDSYRALSQKTGRLWWTSTRIEKLKLALTVEVVVQSTKAAYAVLESAWPEIASSFEALTSGGGDQ